MKKYLAAALLAATCPSAVADILYVPMVHILKPNGDYLERPLKGTQSGMGRTECEMRKDAWLSEYGEAIKIAEQALKEKGKHGSMRISCDRKTEN